MWRCNLSVQRRRPFREPGLGSGPRGDGDVATARTRRSRSSTKRVKAPRRVRSVSSASSSGTARTSRPSAPLLRDVPIRRSRGASTTRAATKLLRAAHADYDPFRVSVELLPAPACARASPRTHRRRGAPDRLGLLAAMPLGRLHNDRSATPWPPNHQPGVSLERRRHSRLSLAARHCRICPHRGSNRRPRVLAVSDKVEALRPPKKLPACPWPCKSPRVWQRKSPSP